MLYIDHNMSHVLPVADRIVLLELGRVVRVIDRGAVTVEELQELVAGRTQLTGRTRDRRRLSNSRISALDPSRLLTRSER